MSSLRQRCDQLLVDRATGDLDGKERQELDRILALHPEWDDDGYELALAELDLAWCEESPLPGRVRQRLIHAGTLWRRM